MKEDEERWNERYRTGKACNPSAAAPILQDTISTLSTRGRALDLACGDGRNALFLARAGFRVDGVDVSEVGLEIAREAAAREALDIHWIHADLDRWEPAENTYDLIACINFLDRRLFDRIPRALKPGGILVFQALLVPEDADAAFTPGFRVRRGELREAFESRGFHILHYSEGEAECKPVAALAASGPVTPAPKS